MRAMTEALWSFWRRGRTVERLGYVVAGLLLASGLVHLGILVLGGGSWEGPLSLRKAMTFGLSFGLTLLTITWVTSLMRLGERWRTVLLGSFTFACVLETVLVSMQAWRGVPSHFNVETPFDAAVARTLAAGGLVLILTIVSLTVAVWRRHADMPVSLRTAIRVGFMTLCASLATGGAMIARGMQLVFAGTPQAAYATGGFLKPTHAVTLHAILVLPALAWMLSFVDWPERRRLHVVLLASAGYVLLVAIVAIDNIAGLAR